MINMQPRTDASVHLYYHGLWDLQKFIRGQKWFPSTNHVTSFSCCSAKSFLNKPKQIYSSNKGELKQMFSAFSLVSLRLAMVYTIFTAIKCFPTTMNHIAGVPSILDIDYFDCYTLYFSALTYVNKVQYLWYTHYPRVQLCKTLLRCICFAQ